ncbi:hypothetical protein IAU60_003958 [Kwoniella sp. DSM 27419]
MSDQPEMSDAEKMRLKRLARLGASPSSARSSPVPVTPSVPAQSPSQTPETGDVSHTPASAASRLLASPQTAMPRVDSPVAKSSILRKPSQASGAPASLPNKRPAPSNSSNEPTGPRVVPVRSQANILHEDYNDWEAKKVEGVLSVTLRRVYRWTRQLCQHLILAGLPSGETIFEYLTGCWKRLYAANKEFYRYSFNDQEKGSKAVGPAEFLPLLLSVTAATESKGDPLLSNPQQVAAQVKPGALSGAELLPFLNDLSAGFPSETMADVITPTLSLFFQEWYKITPTPDIMGSEWRRYLGAVAVLVQVKGIAGLLPTLPIWIAPDVTAPKLEWQSLLGPLIRLSVFPREFSSLFNILNSIIRASPESREGVLDLFSTTLRLNEKRAGMRVDTRTVSSDGFMCNLQVILLKLFEPVMDAQYSKIDRVDPEYFKFSKRVDISEETKIKGTKEEADDYFNNSMQVDTKPNFISDLFFLTNAFIHLGGVKTIGTRTRAEKNMSEIEKELKRAEAMRGSWASNPAMGAQGEARITQLKSDLATLHASLHAYDTQLLDPAFTRLNISFLGFVMTWLVRLVDPARQHPAPMIS